MRANDDTPSSLFYVDFSECPLSPVVFACPRFLHGIIAVGHARLACCLSTSRLSGSLQLWKPFDLIHLHKNDYPLYIALPRSSSACYCILFDDARNCIPTFTLVGPAIQSSIPKADHSQSQRSVAGSVALGHVILDAASTAILRSRALEVCSSVPHRYHHELWTSGKQNLVREISQGLQYHYQGHARECRTHCG